MRFGFGIADNFASHLFVIGLDVVKPVTNEIIRGISFHWKLRHGLSATSIVALGLVLATPARAAELWTGTNSTDWFDAGNWSAGVPTNATSTRIDTVTPNATVIGAAGALSTGLRVGVSGSGALTIQNGGTVNNTLGIIADQLGSTGTVTIDGPGSAWINSSDFYVGSDGNGTLMIQNGGAVSNAYGIIGAYFSSTGAVTVDGAGSTWTNSQDLSVGGSGDGNPNAVRGTLTIRTGGAVSNINGFIGYDSGSTGVVTVDGAGSTWTNSGDLFFGYLGTASGTLTISNGGAVSVGGDSHVGDSAGATGIATVDGTGSNWTTSGSLLVGNGGTGTLTISNGGNVSASDTTIAAQAGSTGTLNIGAALGQAPAAAGTLNTSSVDFGDGTGQIVFNHNSANYIFAPTITSIGSGTGSVDVEAGTTTFTANSSYLRPTIIDGGTLLVNGSIANSSVTVNAGGTLGGNGTVGTTAINGGTLAPSNSVGALTVNGNLSFTGASSYNVGVSATNNDRTNVTGTAALAGATVNASFAPGAYITSQYTILNATGGLGGTTFGTLNTNLPSNFMPVLSYDADNAYLDLTLQFVSAGTTGLNFNQTTVANTLTSYFNRTGGIPGVYAGLSPAGLTQASGEIATATQQTSFDAMTQFMGVMGDAPRAPFQQSWNIWAAGFGGSRTADGDAALGSNSVTSDAYGTAVGADYLVAPNTVAGFALGGGGTNFSVNGLGTGRSDLFQAGVYARHTEGPAYISGTLADGWQDITTNRSVTISGTDQLQANFNTNALSGRVEGGYRIAEPDIGGIGITPYAAAQFTSLALPGYAEQVLSGSNTFALAYGAQNVTDTRSELGLSGDKAFVVGDATLTLSGRAAWAHDLNPDRSAAATFQALPGANFSVNGAAQAQDSALTTASAEMKWLNGWSTAASFEGEFSGVSSSYAGKGVVRYMW